jgi:hypothetical protein
MAHYPAVLSGITLRGGFFMRYEFFLNNCEKFWEYGKNPKKSGEAAWQFISAMVNCRIPYLRLAYFPMWEMLFSIQVLLLRLIHLPSIDPQ